MLYSRDTLNELPFSFLFPFPWGWKTNFPRNNFTGDVHFEVYASQLLGAGGVGKN